ncbi:MAG: DUF2798 domain-containing protein [Bradyrhizobium sp.]|uniref:DUF2798 domain-containing protein n=1 Tax=Bradyrhizobium sp. TaxID=376 RepID=UPI0025C34274|nr:DUF2798 domain-containing protein [Bradyrhizobium sp.]MBI5264266.1 DUF2798 domain-containing protein [Bradyrhizobium sp.]
MLGIPRRYGHYVFGVIQSGVTCLIAAGIASLSAGGTERFFHQWMLSWLLSWAAMVPVVLLAAPLIRSAVLRLTRE